jgi:hypothetical protein
MTSTSKRRWHLIRENIKFQIKLTLDAVRDLLLSPVAIICTVLDIIKGNSLALGHFQRLMQWGHNTDHWLNLFGDLPIKTNVETPAEDRAIDGNQDQDSAPKDISDTLFSEQNNSDKNRVDANLDKLFSKVEALLDEQQQKGGLTKAAQQKIEQYLTALNSNSQLELPETNKNSMVDSNKKKNKPSELKK